MRYKVNQITGELISLEEEASSTSDVDDALSSLSENPVMNKVLKTALDSIAQSNVPIGAVQGFLLAQAPTGWLKCDGGTYAVSDYKSLYDKLVQLPSATRQTWGNADWVTHFNVPNLQGEFLRGSGSNSHVNQGSGGNVGIHQDGTQHNIISPYQVSPTSFQAVFEIDANMQNATQQNVKYSDSNISSSNLTTRRWTNQTLAAVSADSSLPKIQYTSRPTNTSVLYCIKYTYIYDGATDVTESTAIMLGNRLKDLEGRCDYSIIEKVVGTWIDGRLLFQKTLSLSMPSSITDGIEARNFYSFSSLGLNDSYDMMWIYDGFILYLLGSVNPLWRVWNTGTKYTDAVVELQNSIIYVSSNRSNMANCPVYVTIRYVKSID